MKATLLVILASLSFSVADAKLVLSIEGGAGNSSANTTFTYSYLNYITNREVAGNRTIKPVLGANVSLSRRRFFAGVGVRYWMAASEYAAPFLDNGSVAARMDINNRIESIYVPIHVGVHIPVKKVFVEGKVNIGPSFYHHWAEIEGTIGYPPARIVNTPTAFGAVATGAVAGIDLGLGTRLAPKLQMQLKYSFMSYITDVKYFDFAINSSFTARLQDNKPNTHAIMLEASVRL